MIQVQMKWINLIIVVIKIEIPTVVKNHHHYWIMIKQMVKDMIEKEDELQPK